MREELLGPKVEDVAMAVVQQYNEENEIKNGRSILFPSIIHAGGRDSGRASGCS